MMFVSLTFRFGEYPKKTSKPPFGNKGPVTQIKTTQRPNLP